MDTNRLAERLMQAAKAAEMEAGCAAILDNKGRPFSGGRIADARVRATVVATLLTLAEHGSVLDIKRDWALHLADAIELSCE
jgi:hypothetical protein